MWAGSIYFHINFRMAEFGAGPGLLLARRPWGRRRDFDIGWRCISDQTEKLD
jgi:hypothetical protein